MSRMNASNNNGGGYTEEKVGQIPDSELQSTHIQQPIGVLPWIADHLLEP